MRSDPIHPELVPHAPEPQLLPAQLWDLLLIQLSNWRWSWRSLAITSTIAPLLSMLALGSFAQDTGPQALAYILTGNLVLSLMFGNLSKVCSNFTFMRTSGTLHYFAALPIQRSMVILATVLAFLMLSLPSLAVTVLLGSLILHVPLVAHPLLLVVIPLAAVPLSGIGALIATSARTPEEATTLSNLLTFFLLGFGPVLIPPERLPGFMNSLGWVSPATYAASALRQTLLGPLTGRLALDVAVLILLSIAVFWLVSRRMDWRSN
jgi:ABC-2 type transport system permease protein